MFHAVRIAIIDEARGQTTHQSEAGINFTQQHTAPVRGDPATVKTAYHLTAPQSVKFELFWFTLCLHKAVFLLGCNSLIARVLCHEKLKNSLFQSYQ